MNLNEHLQQAYEAGRRQALNEQSQGQSDSQQFEYLVQNHTAFFAWLLQNNFISNEEFIELIDYIAAGGTIKDLMNAGFLDTQGGLQWLRDIYMGYVPTDEMMDTFNPGMGTAWFYTHPDFPGLRVPKPPGYVPVDSGPPISK